MFVVVYSLTNSDDVHYVASRTSGSRISLDVTGLTGTEYGVSTFALENGLPFPGVVTLPENITISSSDQGLCIAVHFVITLPGVSNNCRHGTTAVTTCRI